MNGNFSNKIFFSDEALLHSVGMFVNKQNCRIWDSENTQVIEERPLHPEKVTVWCALWSECVIGPYFFENHSHRQFEELWSYDNRLFLPAIEEYDLENMWFQQDGAICHKTRANTAIVRDILRRRNFSSDINLTPLDFFCAATQKTVIMQINLHPLST